MVALYVLGIILSLGTSGGMLYLLTFQREWVEREWAWAENWNGDKVCTCADCKALQEQQGKAKV